MAIEILTAAYVYLITNPNTNASNVINREQNQCISCFITNNLNLDFSAQNLSENNEKILEVPAINLEKIRQKSQSSNTEKFRILSVGYNVGERSVITSSFVRGYEDGNQAIDFDNWLIPLNDFTTALNLSVKSLENGEIELRSVGIVTRIKANELKIDPKLGLVISIADIQNKFGIKCKFDIANYAIVFYPPWLNLENQQAANPDIPIDLTDLPVIKPPNFSFSTIGQKTYVTGSSNYDSTTYQGELMAIGSLLGGSWAMRINQPTLNSTSSWQIMEAQYLLQNDQADYVVGSQPSVWPDRGGSATWGMTTIQRFGYNPPTPMQGGFNPRQRLQSQNVGRSISGEAQPGTLVRLTKGMNDRVIAETLVDSSGVYRFEEVPVSGNSLENYHVLLYPKGQLSAQPEIKAANFANLPGLLTPGTSALMASVGFGRNASNNNFVGNFSNLQGGVGYRFGVTEDLTLGTGIVGNNSVLGLGELFYQPSGFPLTVSASTLMGTDNQYSNSNVNINFNPSPDFGFNFNSDYFAQRFRFNWQALNGVNLRFGGDSLENALRVGINLNQFSQDYFITGNAELDTNNFFRWSLNANLNHWQLRSLGNEVSITSELIYNFSLNSLAGHAITLGYESVSSNLNPDYLVRLTWRYRSRELSKDYRPLWEFNWGYGFGSQNSGLIAGLSTSIIPGLNVGLWYEGATTSNNAGNFRVLLSPVFDLQPQLRPGNSRMERLRSQGGIILQPFLDENDNKNRDNNEPINLEDADLLFLINHKQLKYFQPEITEDGIVLNLAAGRYRIDLDPGGYPLGRKPLESAYAVNVVAGSYTVVSIPMVTSYSVAGTATNNRGEPLAGLKVEAILSQSDKSEKSTFSITNASGIFFLEELGQGTYTLLINGKPASPSTIEINSTSQQIQELNLTIK